MEIRKCLLFIIWATTETKMDVKIFAGPDLNALDLGCALSEGIRFCMVP